MKKIVPALLGMFLLTGCPGPTIVIGKFCPLRNDEGGRPYISAPSSFYKEIRYADFAFDWKREDQFRIYPKANSPKLANWFSLYSTPAKLHTAYGLVQERRHNLAQTDQETLAAMARRFYTPFPGSKEELLRLDIEKCVFKSRPAVKVSYECHEKGRELYTLGTVYIFPHHLQPEKYLFFVEWSERGKKEDYRNEKIARQGELFFRNFRLLFPPGGTSASTLRGN